MERVTKRCASASATVDHDEILLVVMEKVHENAKVTREERKRREEREEEREEMRREREEKRKAQVEVLKEAA